MEIEIIDSGHQVLKEFDSPQGSHFASYNSEMTNSKRTLFLKPIPADNSPSPQTKPETFMKVPSNGLDGRERSFIRDKTADTTGIWEWLELEVCK